MNKIFLILLGSVVSLSLLAAPLSSPIQAQYNGGGNGNGNNGNGNGNGGGNGTGNEGNGNGNNGNGNNGNNGNGNNGNGNGNNNQETARERINRIREELKELRQRRRELRQELRRQIREQRQNSNNGQVLGESEEGESDNNIWLTVLGVALIPAIAAGAIAVFINKK